MYYNFNELKFIEVSHIRSIFIDENQERIMIKGNEIGLPVIERTKTIVEDLLFRLNNEMNSDWVSDC